MRNLKVKTHLPNEILINGKTYKRDCNLTSSLLMGEMSVFGLKMLERTQNKAIAIQPVLSRKLRGKRDLHGKYYTPTVHVFSCEILPTPPTESETLAAQVL